MGIDADLYPVGLIIAGRPCLVVGGGQVAARKVAGLLTCGAAVTLVAPEAHVALRHVDLGMELQILSFYQQRVATSALGA